MGDPRRARDRGAARDRDPSLRRPEARAVAARVGDRRALLRDRLRSRARWLSRGARAAARGAAAPGRAHAWARREHRPEQRRELTRVAGSPATGALELDALLVDSLVNVRYLTGFTGSSAAGSWSATMLGAKLGGHRFLTDFRYATQSAEQVPDAFEREIVTGDLLDALAASLADAGGQARLRRRQPDRQAAQTLAELLGADWELVPRAGAVERLREVKDAGEIARIRAAERARRRGAARGPRRRPGRSHRARGRDRAGAAHAPARRAGAELPLDRRRRRPRRAAARHSPRCSRSRRDVLVTIDWGALHEGYCSDCTRTYATGEAISAQAREIYELVLSAQHAGPRGRHGRAPAAARSTPSHAR